MDGLGKRLTAALGAAALAAASSGCATGSRLTPEQAVNLLHAYRDAGCVGSAGFQAGASTGQLGGEAHVSAHGEGSCDPRNAPKPPPPLVSAVVPGSPPPASETPPT